MDLKTPEVPPHVVVEEIAEISKGYGYYLQYGVELSYWVNDTQYLITLPMPEFLKHGKAE